VERDQHQQITVHLFSGVQNVFCKCHPLTTHYKRSLRQQMLLECYIYTPLCILLILQSVNIREEQLMLEKMNACLWIYLKNHKKFSIRVLTKHRDTRLLPRFHSLVLNSYHSFCSCSGDLHRFFLLSFHEKMGNPWTKENKDYCLSNQFQQRSECWH